MPPKNYVIRLEETFRPLLDPLVNKIAVFPGALLAGVLLRMSVMVVSSSLLLLQTQGAAPGSSMTDAPPGLFAQNVAVQPNSVPPAAPKSAVLEKAEKIILPKIEFSDATIRDVVAALATKSRELDPEGKGVKFFVTLPPTDTTTISVSLENVPLTEAVKYVAQLVGLEVDAIGDEIVLRQPKGKAAAMQEPAAGTPAAALLGRARGILLAKVEFKDATAAEGVEFFRKRSGELDLEKRPVNIVLKESKASAETRVTMSLANVSVAEALGSFAQLLGLQLEVAPDAFVLRPPAE
jgi:hypothetical protein